VIRIQSVNSETSSAAIRQPFCFPNVSPVNKRHKSQRFNEDFFQNLAGKVATAMSNFSPPRQDNELSEIMNTISGPRSQADI